MSQTYVQPEPSVAAVDVSAAPARPVGVLAACLLAMMSGVLMGACYQPLNLHWLAWIAMVPWLMVLPRLPAGKVWPCGLLVGLGYYGIALAWLTQLDWARGLIVIFSFILLVGFSFHVARLLMNRFGTAAMIWAVPLAFTGQEVMRSEGLGRFRMAFAAWGYSQSHNLWIAQIASLGGVYFLTFLLTMFSAALAFALLRRRFLAYMPAAGVAAGIVLLGVLAQPRLHSSHPAVPVACVQAEILGYMQYPKLVEKAARDEHHPAIIVMPEHSLLDIRPEHDPEIEMLSDLARQTGTYICAAGDARIDRPVAVCPFDNKAMLIDPTGHIILEQLKSVPIPFFQDGNPATHQQVASTEHGTIGIYICYDGTFTDIPRHLASLGAELLLGPVMDPADWPEQERRQHADVAIFRAIELRRCIVRAASCGVSQVIDATGRVTAMRGKQQGQGLLFGKVRPHSDRTLFVRGGYVFAPAVCILFLIIVAAMTLDDWRKRLQRQYRRHGRCAAESRQESSVAV